MSVKVELESKLPTIMASLPDALRLLVQRQTLEMHRLARQMAPVDTGNLRNSGKDFITWGTAGGSGTVSFNAEYAAYVNFGTGQRGAASAVPERPAEVRYGQTVGMVARPYLSLAAVQSVAELQRLLTRLEGYLF